MGNRSLEHANPHVRCKHSEVNCLLSCKRLPWVLRSEEVGVALVCTNCFSSIPPGAPLNNPLAEVCRYKNKPLSAHTHAISSLLTLSHMQWFTHTHTHPFTMWCENKLKSQLTKPGSFEYATKINWAGSNPSSMTRKPMGLKAIHAGWMQAMCD